MLLLSTFKILNNIYILEKNRELKLNLIAEIFVLTEIVMQDKSSNYVLCWKF